MAQAVVGRDSVPVARSNAGFSVFAEEKKVTSKRSKKAPVMATCTRCGAELDINDIGESGMCVPCEEETFEECAQDAYTMAYGEPRGTDAVIPEQPEDEQIATLEASMANEAGQEQPTEQVPAPVKPLTTKQQREELKAARLRVCNRHLMYLDRLPDEAKVAVEGHPVEVRSLSEFARGANWEAPCCKPCYKIYDTEWRDAHRTPGTPTSKDKQQATLARLIEQRDALTARIEALQAQA